MSAESEPVRLTGIGVRVALLRGVNVGRASRVAMADLREVMTRLGYRDVSTLLSSGNVVFSSPDPSSALESDETRIGTALEGATGVAARVVVFASEEIADAIRSNTLAAVADNPSRLLVAFLAETADSARLEPLLAEDWGDEALAVGTRVAYMWCPEGVIASRLAKAVERALAGRVTTRSWATVLKLGALTSALDPPDTHD
ncbi:MAG TPA: DUF1697 domain-containing protein [Cellulomonadaceae bacterium]|nr:DUF1697 domain-containing protein [Cellulomonadaceae bacterium]